MSEFDDAWIEPVGSRGPACLECGQVDCTCDDCPTCKGTGTVNPLTAPAEFFCAVVADCPHCDGTGRMS